MVTAIVIPIICLYFFWLTRKEMKDHKEQWLQLDNVTEESILSGIIKDIREEKQRFYYHYFMQVIEITLQTEFKQVKARKVSPYKKGMAPFHVNINEHVRLFGKYEKEYFIINRVEKDES